MHDDKVVSVDHLQIKVTNLEMCLQAKAIDLAHRGIVHRVTTLFFSSMVLSQGHLIALVGSNGKGKTTLSRIVDGSLLPRSDDAEQAQMFIPPHLRVIHVPSHSMFVRGSLYMNLVFKVLDRDSQSKKW